jgi:SAM-dependent methyltransferase
MHSPHLKKAKELWISLLKRGDAVVDATCGNGQDTLFLSQLVRWVYAVDIQEKAIEATKNLLGESNVSLRLGSHADLSWVPEPVRLVVYNLGYLPKGDKSITTQTETTLQSLESALKIVEPGGAISVMCYPGHEEGQREEGAVLKWMRGRGAEHYTWNVEKRAPSLFWLLKPAFSE